MATRKSGDGSRSADVGSSSPGSYVKVSGSRRRRKGRRASTMPPAQASLSEELDTSRIVDTVGESADDEDDDRISDEVAVDDLRRPSKPNSSRAPRKEIGPLGIEDIRSDPPANSAFAGEPDPSEPPSRTPSDPSRMRVVEINSSASHSDRARALFGDDDDEPEDEASANDRDRELADAYALDGNAADSAPEHIRASVRPSSRALARREEEYDDPEDRNSMSSVLGARPSMRASPRPEAQKDPSSMLWWLVVSALVAIIAAALTIAAREHIAQRDQSPQEPEQQPEQVAAPQPEAPAAPPPVSFGVPQTMPQAPAQQPAAAAVAAKPPVVAQPAAPAKVDPATLKRTPVTTPDVPAVPPRLSAAVRAGVPGTGVATGAVAKDMPVSAGPAASAAKPTKPAAAAPAAKPAVPAAPAAAPYAPGYDKPIDESTSYAPGYGAPPAADPKPRPTLRPGPDPERGKPNLTPMREGSSDNSALPANPFD